MRIKNELLNLKGKDIYSLILFVLFKCKELPEYSTLSELAYVLDKDNLLKLCEYFGGVTITVPKLEELESLLYALLMYQYVDVDGMDLGSAEKVIKGSYRDVDAVVSNYLCLKNVLRDYKFTKRDV